ncbi:Ethyl tert-butyl ether degradation EthD [Candidatus Rhodobacter oscarellae]|uniref:Ethyl tert-butyl ether degradation EthD n=1 Tax=Candidatus Rhodobacter oscarellae TaxID=1675527 RepID=A0A0J9E231_9RHOB|nr:EthD family reductase [Candidatus Rhodobacter lobularis]KMW56785.1 Ethyl tert-butyl ether degradation EthD [Candidatus Rhodobacter lobularis]
MTQVSLVVLYPQPSDAAQFNTDYEAHVALLRKHAGIPEDQTPYSVMRFAPNPDGSAAPFYQMFSMPFASGEALQAAMATAGMQEVAADAARISSGGAPVILVGAGA